MKIGSFDITAWTYQGRPLVGVHTMARRAVSFPVLWLGKVVIFLGAWLGWGLDDAKDQWGRLP